MSDDRQFNLTIDEVRLVLMFRKLELDEREDVLNVLAESAREAEEYAATLERDGA